MSAPDSWEDDPSVQEDNNLSKQTQNMNMNGSQPSFRPGVNSFQPGATSFQPGQQYPQYAGGHQQQQYGYGQQQGYGGYQQYGQQGYSQYNQNYNQQSGGHSNNYGGQFAAYNQTPGQFGAAQQSGQRTAPVSIAKRPSANEAAQSPPVKAQNKADAEVPKAKVLSIGSDGTAAAAPKAKVLSIGVPATPAASKTEKKAESPTTKEAPTADAGAKAVAQKVVEKTKEPVASKSSPPSSGRSSPTPAEKRTAARDADAVIKEQTADVNEDILAEVYGKEHVNIIFIGHVDAGKSTLGGSILYATGMVDERTMDKYKREAKDASRETWYLSWALDLTKEERAKGKTVEVGRGFFETEKRRYSILDAPGHKTFVPNMIGGASQADVGILVISARKGEYETGFEKGGQTREHAMLAKTQGVNHLIVAVNKMDDPTVEWSKERYNECISKLTVFLKSVGYNPKTDLFFMPISAQTTQGIKNRVSKEICPWYDGPSLLEYLDDMAKLERKVNAPFMMPVAGKYRDMGTMIEGRIEAGCDTEKHGLSHDAK